MARVRRGPLSLGVAAAAAAAKRCVRPTQAVAGRREAQ